MGIGVTYRLTLYTVVLFRFWLRAIKDETPPARLCLRLTLACVTASGGPQHHAVYARHAVAFDAATCSACDVGRATGVAA